MGWAGGTRVILAVAHAIVDTLDPSDRRLVYRALVPELDESDWDDPHGAKGVDEVLDQVLAEHFPWLDGDDTSEDEDVSIELCRGCGVELGRDGDCGTLNCDGGDTEG